MIASLLTALRQRRDDCVCRMSLRRICGLPWYATHRDVVRVIRDEAEMGEAWRGVTS